MTKQSADRAVTVEGVSLHLAHPDDLPVRWVGQKELLRQLLAAWMVVDERDLPMNPRLLGKPGVGKTTLAYAAARELGREAYIFQATMDTRPEDLLVSPVISGAGQLRYVASPLVTAMLRGGVCILDEGNRMSEKSWASLAPLLDTRRYVESIVAGIKIKAHADFRLVAATHPSSREAVPSVKTYVTHGASPRAAIALAESSRAVALLAGRPTVGFEDVQAVTAAVLNHRLILNYKARLDQVDTFAVIRDLIAGLDETDLGLPSDVEVAEVNNG